jgi:CheY-like chemotaxis protein
LGLSIVRQLVELHGGTVGVQSEGEGKGTLFSVRLPLFAVQMPTPPATNVSLRQTQSSTQSQPEAAASTESSLQNAKILVVEDEADSRDIISVVLTASGAEVRTARSVKEGLELLQAWQPNLLISDIGMPHEDGYALIQQVRQLPATAGGAIPAIALTAYARPEDRNKALALGFQQHLTKPISPTELNAAVASLRNSQTHQG